MHRLPRKQRSDVHTTTYGVPASRHLDPTAHRMQRVIEILENSPSPAGANPAASAPAASCTTTAETATRRSASIQNHATCAQFPAGSDTLSASIPHRPREDPISTQSFRTPEVQDSQLPGPSWEVRQTSAHATCSCADIIDLTDLCDEGGPVTTQHAVQHDGSAPSLSHNDGHGLHGLQSAIASQQHGQADSIGQHHGVPFAHQNLVDGWACKRCTLLNNARDSHCLACTQWRYARHLPVP